jgi:hypothetical protein
VLLSKAAAKVTALLLKKTTLLRFFFQAGISPPQNIADFVKKTFVLLLRLGLKIALVSLLFDFLMRSQEIVGVGRSKKSIST